MKQTTLEAYAEVDMVLNLMDKKYVEEIPEKIRKIFKERKASNCSTDMIVKEKSLKEQLSEEALSILAVLNYNYWCKDEERKKALLNIYMENEKKYQQELKEKYNPDNIFKKNIQKPEQEISNSQNKLAIVEYKESIFRRFINKIKNILNLK